MFVVFVILMLLFCMSRLFSVSILQYRKDGRAKEGAGADGKMTNDEEAREEGKTSVEYRA